MIMRCVLTDEVNRSRGEDKYKRVGRSSEQLAREANLGRHAYGVVPRFLKTRHILKQTERTAQPAPLELRPRSLQMNNQTETKSESTEVITRGTIPN